MAGGGGWPIGGTNRVLGVGVAGVGVGPLGVVRGAITGVTPVDGGGAPAGWGVGVGPNSGGTNDGDCGPGEPKITGGGAPTVTGLT